MTFKTASFDAAYQRKRERTYQLHCLDALLNSQVVDAECAFASVDRRRLAQVPLQTCNQTQARRNANAQGVTSLLRRARIAKAAHASIVIQQQWRQVRDTMATTTPRVGVV